MRPPVRNRQPTSGTLRETATRQKRARNEEVEDGRRSKRPNHEILPSRDRGERHHRSNQIVSDDEESDDGVRPDEVRQVLSELLRTKCRLYRVTPMMISDVNVNTFRRWSKIVQLALIQNNTYQCTNKDWEYRVEFTTLNGIAKSDNDANALQFKIYRKECVSGLSRAQANELSFSVVCNGIFAARETQKRKRGLKKWSHLPLLLINGPEGIFKAVKQSIEGLLNCVIVPMNDISSSQIKIIAGRYLMTSWLNEDVDKNSQLTFYFSVEKIGHGEFDHEGSVPLKAFENVIERFTTVTNKNVTLLWFDFFNSLNTPVMMDFYTPTCKMASKTFAIANTGSIKVKKPSIATCLDLISSLTWCAEGRSSQLNQH